MPPGSLRSRSAPCSCTSCFRSTRTKNSCSRSTTRKTWPPHPKRSGNNPSDALERLESAVLYRRDELAVVLVVLIRVAQREVGDCLVEAILLPQVRCERDGV